MPTISPFGISDKNTYKPKLMYTNCHTNFDFSKFIFVKLLYIHLHISPSYIRHDVYMQTLNILIHIVFPSCILYTYLYSLLFIKTKNSFSYCSISLLLYSLPLSLYYLPLIYVISPLLYSLPLFDNNAKGLYKLFT